MTGVQTCALPISAQEPGDIDRDGMTLDEIAGFLRRAMLAGIDPDTPVRVRATRKGAVASMTVDGVATHG